MAKRVLRAETLNYRPGGFHPVHLNDTFKKGRYVVIHKLGHGGFATVWLARDTVRLRYVALKILAARLTRDCPEVDMLRRLRSADDHKGKRYVMSMLDHFFIDGPNGHHLCVVSEVGGPSIKQFNDCPGFKSGTRRLRGEVARSVALQATEGLAFIHDVGIVHGDFTAANILLQLANINSWTIVEIHERLGTPQTEDIHGSPGTPDNLFGPQYTVKDISMKEVNPKWLSDQIMIIDFGIAFLQEQSSPDIGTPKAYCAPEFLFEIPRSVGSDVWALGCTIFEIRTGSSLFRYRGVPTRDQQLMGIVEMLGKLPLEWWDRWEKGREWYGNEIKVGGELAETIQGTLHQDIMEIGLHDGDAATWPSNRINAAFAEHKAAALPHATLSEQHHERTNRLVALVEELTTSEAAEVIALINKSSSSQEKSSSKTSPASGSGSGSTGRVSKGSASGSGSGTISSSTKSGEKSISSEGLSNGKLSTAREKATIPEQNIVNPQGGPFLATVAEFLEMKGTTITRVEGCDLEDLLRKALKFLPEERPFPEDLSKHKWFSTNYIEDFIALKGEPEDEAEA